MKLYLTVLAALLSLLALAVTSSAQFEGAVWDTLTSDNVRDKLSRQALCSAGKRLYLTYAKARGDEGWNVHYRYYSLIRGWSEDRIVESDMPCFAPVIAANDVGDRRIAILFESGGDIYGDVIHEPSDDWNPANLTHSPSEDLWPSVALDDSGALHFSWITRSDTLYELAYGKTIGPWLSIETIKEAYLGEYGSGAMPFIVTVEGLPHIFYRGVDARSYRIFHSYKESPGREWTTEIITTENEEDYFASAVVDQSGDIHLAISGNMGWGMDSHVYYLRRDHRTGTWSVPMMVLGYSASDGSIGITDDGVVFVTSTGVSGNFYTGEIFLCKGNHDHFDTELLATLAGGEQPIIAFLSGTYGAIVSQAAIRGVGPQNVEIVYYGPAPNAIGPGEPVPERPLLHFCYPNPFNSQALISMQGPNLGNTPIDIFNVLGSRVKMLRPCQWSEGSARYSWDGLSEDGTPCASGIYFYAVTGLGKGYLGKITLLR